MKFHREGHIIIVSTILILVLANLLVYFWLQPIFFIVSLVASLVILILIMQFFRVPNRVVVVDEGLAICPADGKVVAIEEVVEPEYFNDTRLQVSIFMSPLNVHINWYPISGKVAYYKYHPGKYLVAWHPKSSTENERTTVVVAQKDGTEVLFRQIAGAVARRIICYASEGAEAKQSSEFGFIKFGSRVDVFLPLGSNVKVAIGDMVTGSQTVLAAMPKANA